MAIELTTEGLDFSRTSAPEYALFGFIAVVLILGVSGAIALKARSR